MHFGVPNHPSRNLGVFCCCNSIFLCTQYGCVTAQNIVTKIQVVCWEKRYDLLNAFLKQINDCCNWSYRHRVCYTFRSLRGTYSTVQKSVGDTWCNNICIYQLGFRVCCSVASSLWFISCPCEWESEWELGASLGLGLLEVSLSHAAITATLKIYFSTFFLAWIILPMQMEYHNSGHFSFNEKVSCSILSHYPHQIIISVD